jgi:hypothetical protein
MAAPEAQANPEARTVADRLRGARRRRFVGRAAELELFRDALEAGEPPFCVLFVHGPGGVGKTALLDALGAAAEAAGLQPVRLDLRAIEPSPPAFLAALATARGLPEDAGAVAATTAGRPVLLLDTFEAAVGLEDWLREELVPALPAGALVVIAGRLPPGPAWRRDPGWAELLRVLSLRNLGPEDARAYLTGAGVDPGLHARVLELTHGHPLALTLLVDVLAQRPGGLDAGALELGAVPDVLRPLLAGFTAGVPSARHRLALELSAQARYTTEDLLRAVLGEDEAGELFAWLRDVSFVEAAPEGLLPHDLAREVIDAEARWRDPVVHEDLHRRIRRHVVARIWATHGREHERAITDLLFLHRANPATRALWDWDSLGTVYADRVREGDRDAILAMTERHEGAESAAIAAHWLERRPDRFWVFRGAGGEPFGYTATLELHRAEPEDLERDPAAAALLAHAQRHRAPRPGEDVLVARFNIDRDAYQSLSPSFNVVTMLSLQEWVSRPRLAWFYIAWADAEAGAPMMRYIDFQRAPDADFVVGGRRYGVYARDWSRGSGAEGWLDMMAERELGAGPVERAPGEPAALLALSQPDFADAVRRALRGLHRPAELAANPLLRTRIVAGHGEGTASPEALAAVVREAVAALAEDPRDEKLFRALDRTYLRPAPTQERAAELLVLPFSTYRGHLTRGVERVVDALWERELYAPAR